MIVCDVWGLNKHTQIYVKEWGWDNTQQQQHRASLSLSRANLQTNQIPNKPLKHTHTHKNTNLLRSLFPWQHRLVLMMFLPSRQAGFGRITAQIGALLPVTKGGFRKREREREQEQERKRERERGADGWKNCHFEENPNPHAQLGSAILIWMDGREENLVAYE